MDLRDVLALPDAYNFFQALIGTDRLRRVVATEFIRARPGDKVLDIGCGTARIRPYLGEVDYYGADADERYLNSARRTFKGRFVRLSVPPRPTDELPSGFDVALAVGLLHHLDDEQAVSFFRLAKASLRGGGRLITVDACVDPSQGAVARFIVTRDRGQHIRRPAEYQALARRVFGTAAATLRHDLLRVPFSHTILECSKPE